MTMITTMAQKFNGITVGFLMGGVNAFFGVLIAFGITLSDSEIASLDAFINFALIFAVWIAHRVGEDHANQVNAAASGVKHSAPQPVTVQSVAASPPPPAGV